MKNGKSNIDIVKDYLAGERPFVQVGYSGERYKHRKEGEVWKDNDGIEWKRENNQNIRLTKTQGDIIREAIGEQKCKHCKLNIKWGNRFDQKMFSKTGLCQDCLIDYETKLRMIGAYDYYERWKILSNQAGYLKDLKQKIEETIKYFTESDGTIEILCNSEGFRERFHGTNKEIILENAKKDLKELRGLLKGVITARNSAKKELKEKTAEYKLKMYA